MNRKEALLWTLYQDLYPKFLTGEVDFFYLNHVREQLFDTSEDSMEEVFDEIYADLDQEFDLN